MRPSASKPAGAAKFRETRRRMHFCRYPRRLCQNEGGQRVPLAVVLHVRVSKSGKPISRLPSGPLAHHACYYSALICDERNRLDFARKTLLAPLGLLFLFSGSVLLLPSSPSQIGISPSSPPHPVEQELIRPPWHRQARRRSRWPSVSDRSTTRVRKAASCKDLFFFRRVESMMSTESNLQFCSTSRIHTHTYPHPHTFLLT